MERAIPANNKANGRQSKEQLGVIMLQYLINLLKLLLHDKNDTDGGRFLCKNLD